MASPSRGPPPPTTAPPDPITARAEAEAAATCSSECLASLLARPARPCSPSLGTVVGVAALVATLGLSKTAGNQIVGRFDELAATDIVVTPKAGTTGTAPTDRPCPGTPKPGAERLNGVVAAGPSERRRPRGATSSRPCRSTTPRARPSSRCRSRPPRAGAVRRGAGAAPPGRLLRRRPLERADRVAVLGPNARPSSSTSPGSTTSPRSTSATSSTS